MPALVADQRGERVAIDFDQAAPGEARGVAEALECSRGIGLSNVSPGARRERETGCISTDPVTDRQILASG